MESWVQTELDSGERVISERLPHVRSATVGYWIATGSRDETDAKAGISHFIEHLLFKGSSRYGALEIAEIFDEMGGELNAATSREHTVVYGRVPEHHVETALDVMGDMVFSPLFDDLDAERAVVLEEIAMYEDTPQELVHDLIGEAVFGSHALGRPVIGTAEVISTRQQARAARATTPPSTRRRTSSSRPRAASTTTSSSRWSQRSIERRGGHHARQAADPPAAREAPEAGPALPAQGHRAVPRLPRRDRRLALRPAPLRRLDPRRDPRRLRLLAAVPGDPREAGDGLLRLQLPLAVRRHAGRSASTSARARRTSRRRSRSPWSRSPTSPPGTSRRASSTPRPGEPEGAAAALDGVDLGPDDAAREVARRPTPRSSRSTAWSPRSTASTPRPSAALAAELLAPERLSAAGIGPSEEHFLAALEQATPTLARAA